MIEDMNARKLCAGTQRGHIHSCKRFAAFLKRSPDTATAEDIRRFQLHLSETGASICNRNRIMTGLRFLFRVTLRRLDLAAEIYHLREPQKIPLVMSQDETRRLLAVAGNLKVRVLLSLGYGCGLRAGEVVRLQVKHIDSAQKIIRIEQSKSRKDRNVMLSPETLDLLRQWWKTRRRGFDSTTPMAERWLFPGQRPGKPMTTRQLNRLFHEAADAAGIRKGVTLRGTDIRIIQAPLEATTYCPPTPDRGADLLSVPSAVRRHGAYHQAIRLPWHQSGYHSATRRIGRLHPCMDDARIGRAA
jgi:integrase